jgi:hypothetical protein
MTPPFSPPALLLWVADQECRDLLVNILTAQEYVPRVVGQPAEALQTLKGHEQATVFVDCQVVSTYGPGLYAKLKVACPRGRVVLLCDKSHHEHRDRPGTWGFMPVCWPLLRTGRSWPWCATARPASLPAGARLEAGKNIDESPGKVSQEFRTSWSQKST